MIIFLSQYDDLELKQYAAKFTDKTGIKTVYKTVTDIINTEINICCKNNAFSSVIDGINFNKIKICYINSGLTTYKNLFDFDSELDNEYAFQEWNASITCLLSINKKTKFINPYVSKQYCNNQIENSIIFQKYGIDTPEAFLTNNSEVFLNFYQIYNENMIIKNVIAGSNKYKLFTVEDLKNLPKLYLSPYIFQNNTAGIPVSIILIGNKSLAVNELTKELISIPSGLEEKLTNIARDINATIIKYRAIYDGSTFLFYDIEQNHIFSPTKSLFGETYTNMLTDYLLKEYKK